MSIESERDRLEMLKALGGLVIFRNTEIFGVYDEDFVELGFDRAVESSQPTLQCRTSDLPGVRHGDTVSVEGRLYEIVGVHPDGQGMTTLRLSAP